jgi:uncharacterized membrane protein
MAQRTAEWNRVEGVRRDGPVVAEHRTSNRGALVLPGLLLGIGLGGFVDGIVLHQIMQWHHMLTATGDHPANTVAGLETNTLWDGLFHASTWLATAVGLVLLWRTARRGDVPWSGRAMLGLMAAGWGLFNLVEGIVDHHILGIHHVRDDVSNTLAWDLGFLAFGALLVAVGWWLYRTTEAPAPGHGEA